MFFRTRNVSAGSVFLHIQALGYKKVRHIFDFFTYRQNMSYLKQGVPPHIILLLNVFL